MLVLSVLSFGANAALVDRGSGLIYDDALDITWLQDANYAQTSSFDSNGRMTWDTAIAWAGGLSYSGYDDWRLPTTASPDPNCSEHPSEPSGTGCTGSEMGHLFYSDGISQSNPGVFVNVLPPPGEGYWSETEYSPYPIPFVTAFAFNPDNGDQTWAIKSNSFYAWAVTDGDVAASVIPIPAAVWLFGSGLGLLGWMRKKAS
jgi:hypothetical protein